MKDGFRCKTLVFVLGISLGIFIKFFVLDIFQVCGSSMEPILEDGQYVAAFKLSYGIVKPFSSTLIVQWAEPKRGDIVIFMHDNNLVVKRCVAESGVVLDYSSDNGYNLIVCGSEYALTTEQYYKLKDAVEVPDGMILVIGDNSSSSIDSRDYGFVPTHCVLGKALCR